MEETNERKTNFTLKFIHRLRFAQNDKHCHSEEHVGAIHELPLPD